MLDAALACLTATGIVVAVTLTGSLVGSVVKVWPAGQRGSGALPGSVDEWLQAFAVGAATWTLLMFGIAAAGLLRSGLVLGLALLLPALALLRRQRVAARLPTGPRKERHAAEQTAVTDRLTRFGTIAIGIAVAVVLAAHAVRALLPDVSWDADVYHLTVPRLYLEHGGFFRVPLNVYSNWPLGVEMLYAVALALRDHVPAKLLHFAFGALTATVAWRLARPGRFAGPLAACLFLANPVVLGELTRADVDLAYAFFLAVGFAAVDRALDLMRDPEIAAGSAKAGGLLLVAGICSGALCATKVTGLFGAACLGLLLLVGLPWRRGGAARRASLAAVVRLVVPTLVLALPWPLKSWWLTGNPVYPFLHEQLGGPDWSPRVGEQLASWMRTIGMGREPLDYLLLPIRVVLRGGPGYASFDGRIAPTWIVLVPIALLGALGARSDRRTRRALSVSGVYFVLWALSSQQMRFLIPILPLLAVASARSVSSHCGWIATRFRTSHPRSAQVAEAAAGLVAATGAATLLAVLAFPTLVSSTRLLPGLVTDYAGAREVVVHPAYRYASQQLPDDARILMINHNRGYFVRRPYLADSMFEASQIADMFRFDDKAAALGRLRALGITHVLLADVDLIRDYPRGLVEVLADREIARLEYRSPDEKIGILALARPREPEVDAR